MAFDASAFEEIVEALLLDQFKVNLPATQK